MKLSFMFMLMIISTGLVNGWRFRGNPSHCENKNAFLRAFKHSGEVHIFDTPVFTSQKCGNEWRQFGSCCEEQSLVRYVNQDTGHIKNYLDRLIMDVKYIKESLQLFIKTLEFIVEKVGHRTDFTNRPRRNQLLLAAVRHIDASRGELHRVYQEMDAADDRIRVHQRGCALKINELRSQSVCSYCSGRSEIYFLNSKAVISEATCSGFIHACFDAWTMLIQIMNGMKKIQELTASLRRVAGRIRFPIQNQAIENLVAWDRSTRLTELVGGCGGSAHGCSQTNRELICNHLLNLRKPSYLQDTADYLSAAKKDDYVSDMHTLRHDRDRFFQELISQIQAALHIDGERRLLEASPDRRPAEGFRLSAELRELEQFKQGLGGASGPAALPAGRSSKASQRLLWNNFDADHHMLNNVGAHGLANAVASSGTHLSDTVVVPTTIINSIGVDRLQPIKTDDVQFP
jgi:hypothetical protein